MTLRNLGCVRFLQLTSCLEIMLSLLVLLFLIIFIFVIIIMPSLLVLFILHIFLKVRGCPYITYYGMGGGLPDLLQYYIGGVLKVYYNITVLKGKWKVIMLFQL